MAEPTPRGRAPHTDPRGSGPPPRIRTPLIWFSGADPEILAKSPGDRARYTGMGSAVLFTAAMGGLSMCVAMRMALHLPLAAAVPVAAGWFLGIAGLDRWLVSSMDKPSGDTDDSDTWDAPAPARHPAWLAVPRLVLAMLFGLVISTPLTLLIFDSEIKPEIQKIHQQEWDEHTHVTQTGSSGVTIKNLQARKAQLQEVVNSGGRSGDPAVSNGDVLAYDRQLGDLQHRYDGEMMKAACESDGENKGGDCSGTSGRSGCASLCQSHRSAAARLRSQMEGIKKQRAALVSRLRRQDTATVKERLDQATRDLGKVDQQLTALQQGQADIDAKWRKENQDNEGLLIRMEALDRAAKGHGTLQASRAVLFLFFTAIECLPVIVKLMMSGGAYEALARERRKRDEVNGKREMKVRDRVDAQRYEDEMYHADRLRAARRSIIDDLVEETSVLEKDVARRLLHWWHLRATGRLPAPPAQALPGGPSPAPPLAPQAADMFRPAAPPGPAPASPAPFAPQAYPPPPSGRAEHSPSTIQVPSTNAPASDAGQGAAPGIGGLPHMDVVPSGAGAPGSAPAAGTPGGRGAATPDHENGRRRGGN